MPRRMILLLLVVWSFLHIAGCANQSNEVSTQPPTPPESITETSTTEAPPAETTLSGLPELTFLGRASVKIKTSTGMIIYIDPYATGKDYYSDPADYILVTHDHDDHNQVSKVKQKETTEIIHCPKNIHPGDVLTFDGLTIKAVEAYNDNHSKSSGCGYILSFDNQVLYHSGDTSTTTEMSTLKNEKITYALLCVDGYYNMGPAEAMEVATLIEAQFVVPIHTASEGYYNADNDAAFTLENTIHMKPGEMISLD